MSRELILSAALHVLLLVGLTLSVDFRASMPNINASSTPVIEARFIDADALAAVEKQKAQEEAAKQREREKQRQQQMAKQKAAEKRKAEAAAKAAEAKKQKELERLAAQRESERKAREEEQKRKAEQAKEEARRRAEQQRQEQERLAAEQAAQQRRRAQQVTTEVDKYQALIQQTIMRYLIKDESFSGKTCRLNIRLASTGLVTKVTRLAGDEALCRAAQSAVLRPDKLPMSSESDVYEKLKDINLTVEL